MKLLIVQGPKEGEFRLPEGEHIAGRDPSNPIHLPSKRVSRQHCSFTVRGQMCVVQDLGSSNGVIVDGARVEELELPDGIRLQLGDYVLAFEQQAETAEALPSFGADPPPVPGAPSAFGGELPASGGWEMEPADSVAFGGEAPAFGDFPGGGFGGPPAAESVPSPSPEAALPALEGGFGSTADGGGFGSTAGGGFGQSMSGASMVRSVDPAAVAGHQAPPAEEPEGVMRHVAAATQFLVGLPWLARLGGVTFLAALFMMVAPLGGILAMMGQANSAMERLAIQQGASMAEILAHHNGPMLAKGRETDLDILPVSKRVGVLDALITGPQGYVKAPAAKRGRSLSNHPLYNESFTSRRPATRMHDGNLEVMAPVIVSVQGLPPGIVGYTFLVYDTKKVVESVGQPTMRALASFVLVLLIFAGLFLVVWQLATRPVRALREETELAIRGHVPQVRSRVRWDSLEELAHSINRTLDRMGGDGAGGQGGSEALETVLEAVPDPLFVLNSSLQLTLANRAALHMFQLDAAALGSPVSQVVTDPDLSGRLQHMLQCIGAGQGTIFADHVSVGGQARRLTVAGRPLGGGQLSHAVVVVT